MWIRCRKNTLLVSSMFVVVIVTARAGVYLVGGAVAVEGDAHLVVALVLTGQSDSSSQRNLTTDNSVTSSAKKNKRSFKIHHAAVWTSGRRGPEGYLRSHDAVTAVEMWSVHVHGTALSFGHAPLAP